MRLGTLADRSHRWMQSRIARSGRGPRLLCLRLVEVGGLACPPHIGKLGEFLDLDLPDDILLLFFKRGRVGTDVSKPLVPLGCKVFPLAYLDKFTNFTAIVLDVSGHSRVTCTSA